MSNDIKRAADEAEQLRRDIKETRTQVVGVLNRAIAKLKRITQDPEQTWEEPESPGGVWDGINRKTGQK